MCIAWGPEHLCLHNDAFAHDLVWQEHHEPGRPGAEVHAELWAELEPQLAFVLSGRGGTWHEERTVSRDGRAGPGHARGESGSNDGARVELTLSYGCHPIYQPDAPHEVGGVLLLFHDVTERVRARTHAEEIEVARRKALHALEAILDHSLDVILTLDRDLRITQVSRSGEATFGLPREALIGRPFAEIVALDERQALEAELSRIVLGESIASFETKVLRVEGSAVPIHWSATWVDAEQRVFAVGRDLSERLDIERRLRSAQRMEAIGRLSGRIAHDFNNILAIVLGNSELLVELLAEDEVARPLAELVTQAAERGATLVSRLLAYSQRQHLERNRLDP
ncbi:MAG TPA: PAS domain S-box protein, partial [Myxococcota bacterium]|nr:PAS domain S-box protein [Myxococcota bacterium]